MKIQLVCPNCKSMLSNKETAFMCYKCNETFPIIDGIPCFENTNEFYESLAKDELPHQNSPGLIKESILRLLRHWSLREVNFLRRSIDRKGVILDLGCGRGKDILCNSSTFIVGIDLCITALKDCMEYYDMVVLGNARKLPFENETFDYVVCSHVFGHIPLNQKNDVISEIYRILKTRGRSINIIETNCHNTLVSHAKKDVEFYKRYFIDFSGHIGMELPSETLKRFQDRGFELLYLKKMDALFVPFHYYLKQFGAIRDYEYREHWIANPKLRWKVKCGELLQNHKYLEILYYFSIGIVHDTLEQWFSNLDNSMFISACFAKK